MKLDLQTQLGKAIWGTDNAFWPLQCHVSGLTSVMLCIFNINSGMHAGQYSVMFSCITSVMYIQSVQCDAWWSLQCHVFWSYQWYVYLIWTIWYMMVITVSCFLVLPMFCIYNLNNMFHDGHYSVMFPSLTNVMYI